MAKIKIIFTFAILSFGLFGLTQNSKALDVIAADLELATVQAAVNQVYDAGGGSVLLPAGTTTWSGASLYMYGGVNLIGFGSPHTYQDSDGQWLPEPTTHIVGARIGGFGSTIVVNVSGSPKAYRYDPLRIANIDFTDAGVGNYPQKFIAIDRGMPEIRVDHNNFYGASYQMTIGTNPVYSSITSTSPRVSGVIDHNNFYGSYSTASAVGNGGYTIYVGAMWKVDNKPIGAASNGDAVFAEDNYWNMKSPLRYEHPISGFSGAHIVLRHNKFLQRDGENWFGNVDVHGPGYPSGSNRGGGPWEVYDNQFIAAANNTDSYQSPAPIRFRSLFGVIFNNRFENTRNAARFLSEQYVCTRSSGRCTASMGNCCDDPGSIFICGYDNIGTSAGYTPKSYIWNNTLVNMRPLSGESNFMITGEACSLTPPYNILASNIVGLNSGTSGDTTMPGYAPYVYPHPLVSGTTPPSDTTPPATPTGLAVN